MGFPRAPFFSRPRPRRSPSASGISRAPSAKSRSTGHSSRLDRKLDMDPRPFGSPDYGKEELIAEMSAAFICSRAGEFKGSTETASARIKDSRPLSRRPTTLRNKNHPHPPQKPRDSHPGVPKDREESKLIPGRQTQAQLPTNPTTLAIMQPRSSWKSPNRWTPPFLWKNCDAASRRRSDSVVGSSNMPFWMSPLGDRKNLASPASA